MLILVAVQVHVLLVNKAALGEQSMPLKVAQVPSIWTQKELLQSGHLGGPTADDVKVMVSTSCQFPLFSEISGHAGAAASACLMSMAFGDTISEHSHR